MSASPFTCFFWAHPRQEIRGGSLLSSTKAATKTTCSPTEQQTIMLTRKNSGGCSQAVGCSLCKLAERLRLPPANAGVAVGLELGVLHEGFSPDSMTSKGAHEAN